MNFPLISEYIDAIKSAEDNFEELSYLRPVLGGDGLPVMTSGNFAVVFKMKDEQSGKLYAVKCFTKEQEGRAEAYREITKELKDVSSPYLVSIRYLEKELFVDTDQTTETEFPVLLMDWVEGKTLDKYLRENLDDKYALEMLAYDFSQLAQWLIPQPFAHGDLKPDNILVRFDGSLVLVDYDGMYVPAMKGQKARELGSPDFRHPLRTEDDFNEFVDDFPIATILFSLNHISKNPSLLSKFGSSDRLLLSRNDYYNINDAIVIQYIYFADEFIDTNYRILYLTLHDGYFKNVELSWLKALNKPLVPQEKKVPPHVKIIFNGEIINMIYVEGGCFFMGAQGKSARMPNYDFESALGDPFGYIEEISEGPVKKIKVDGFWISDSLLTINLWPWFEDNPDGIYPYNIRKRRNDDKLYAVYGMSYDKCKSFMRTLSKATSVKFDFPTEPEWEYAARGGVNSDGYKYAGSDSIDEVAVYGKEINQYGIPLCRVKTKKPNELGIYDMSGGLYEWCKDSMDNSKNDLKEYKSHYIRGGCMNSDARRCRITYRNIFYEKEYYEYEPYWWQVGLRLVARNIDLNKVSNNCIVSLNEDATEDEKSNAITDEFGAKYTKDGTKLISAPNNLFFYEVRPGVKVICREALLDSTIEEIRLPDSLQVIGDQAFWGAKRLKEIVIPPNVYRLGVQSFYSCESLRHVCLSQSVNYIESYGFSGCSSLQTIAIPNNVDVLEPNLFSFCESLENVSLPESLTKICDNAFGNCKSMKTITIPKNVCEIENNPFRGSGITEIKCETPTFIFENGFLMTADKSELIACLTNTKYLSVPSSIKIIRGHAFNGCKTVEQVFLPEGLTDIKEYAFSEFSTLSEIVIPSTVKSIQRGFLAECPTIKRLVIHSKDIWIDDNSTFYEAKNIAQIIIPKEITESFNKKFPKFINIVEEY